MDFKEFFTKNEIFDAALGREIEANVVPTSSGNGYIYEFYIGEKNYDNKYDVSFNKTGIEVAVNNGFDYEKVDHSYEVVFHGPGGNVMPTNKNIAGQVYSHLLAGFEAFLNMVQPNGLYFYGATEGMDLVYNRFTKKFLADDPGKPDYLVFYRISDRQYISKQFYKESTSEVKKGIDAARSSWGRDEVSYLQRKKTERASARERFRKLIKSIGHFIRYDGYFGLIFQVTPEDIMAVVLNYDGNLRQRKFRSYYVMDDHGGSRNIFEPQNLFKPETLMQVTKEDIMNFLDNLFDVNKAQENEDMLKLIKQHIPQNIINLVSTMYYREKVRSTARKLPHRSRTVDDNLDAIHNSLDALGAPR